jgi:hypothetical protein
LASENFIWKRSISLAKSHFIEALEQVEGAVTKADLTIQDIFVMLGEKGHLVLILFLSVPFLQPIPLVGISIPMGVLIVIVGYYFLIEKPPWLPTRFALLVVPKPVLLKTIHLIQKIWRQLDKVLDPRWPRLHDARAFRVFNFLLVATSAFLLSLPLPIPFSNIVPALGIVLNTIGLIEEDGVVISISYLIFLLCLLFFASLGAGVFIGIDRYYDKLMPMIGF